MVDDAHLGFGDADMATVDRADLARMMRENTELSDGCLLYTSDVYKRQPIQRVIHNL